MFIRTTSSVCRNTDFSTDVITLRRSASGSEMADMGRLRAVHRTVLSNSLSSAVKADAHSRSISDRNGEPNHGSRAHTRRHRQVLELG